MRKRAANHLLLCLSFLMMSHVACDRLKKTTPLVSALRAGDVAKVKKLLKQGARVNTTLRDGSTPMIAAAQSGKLKLIKLLLSKGAAPNAIDSSKKTPLIYANYHCKGDERYQCIRALIEKGADPKSLQGKIDVMQAVCLGGKSAYREEAVAYYLKKGLMKVSHDMGKLGTPMHCAASHGALDVAKFLVKHGAKATINQRDSKGRTALHVACDRGKNKLEIIKLLIKQGIKINALDKQKKPAYYYLAPGDATAAMLFLLKHGGAPGTPNKYLGNPKTFCKSAKDDAALLTCVKKRLTSKPTPSQ